MTVILACAIFVVTYELIATERIDRVTVALGDAAAMALVGVVDTQTAFYSQESGVDRSSAVTTETNPVSAA